MEKNPGSYCYNSFYLEACLNFISLKFATKLGISADGPMAEVESACPGNAESITLIPEKALDHIPGCRDVEEFYGI